MSDPPPERSLLDGPFRLSRFAYVRPDADAFVLESPRTAARMTLSSPAALGLLFQLRTPTTLAALLDGHPPAVRETIAAIVRALEAHEMLTAAGPGAGEDDGPLRYWDFHDLLFHARSRLGRAHRPVGGTYRFGEGPAPGPEAKRYAEADAIPLARPDKDAVRATDPAFVEVAERRRSTRTFGPPLALDRLGAFLFRTCRVKAGGQRRPYPSGGATYPLEAYLVVDAVDGLAPGLYHYDAAGHALAPLPADAGRLASARAAAGRALGTDAVPPVLLCFTARLGRTAHKYESIAYNLILKEVGGLYQTLWLTAAAMDLAACAVGVGDADLLAGLLGTDYYAEPSVGEFVLGTMPDGGAGPPASDDLGSGAPRA